MEVYDQLIKEEPNSDYAYSSSPRFWLQIFVLISYNKPKPCSIRSVAAIAIDINTKEKCAKN